MLKFVGGCAAVALAIGIWLGAVLALGNADQRREEARRAENAEANKKSVAEWHGGVYSYTDHRSGQRYLIVSYRGGVAMIKAEPDKLPEAE